MVNLRLCMFSNKNLLLYEGHISTRKKRVILSLLCLILLAGYEVVWLKSVWSELTVHDTTLTRFRFNYGTMSYEVHVFFIKL